MTILVYGAYGYTGELIAREAVDRGLEVILAGRNGTKTRSLAAKLDVPGRVFAPEDASSSLTGVDLVLNCAGPFGRTYEPFLEACLDTGTHYLDITGELDVFEAIARRDREAEEAGVCLLPGVGFDVVPTDCLAAHLHDRMPDSDRIALGVDATTRFSGGTLATLVGSIGDRGRIRRDGRIETVPLASKSRSVDLGSGPRNAVRVPLGDVSTAYYTTGIGNVETYVAAHESLAWLFRLVETVGWVFELDPVKRALQSLVRRVVDGPGESYRDSARAFVWGEVTDGNRTVTTGLVTPEPYALTVDAATTAAERLDARTAPVGYATPATALGPAFVLDLDGVEGFYTCRRNY